MNLIESMLIWNQLLESLQFLCFEIDETIIHIFPLFLNQLTGLWISISLFLSIYLSISPVNCAAPFNPSYLIHSFWLRLSAVGNDSSVRFFEKNI